MNKGFPDPLSYAEWEGQNSIGAARYLGLLCLLALAACEGTQGTHGPAAPPPVMVEVDAVQ